MVEYDAVIIGAGFFGIEIALELRRLGFERVLLVEKERGIMRRASSINQARVHNGYHYPRSLATAERSRANYAAFVTEYADAVIGGMESVYAVARGSRVSGAQFETFCSLLSAPCRPAPCRIAALFDNSLIEAAYLTQEVAFDANRLMVRARAALDASEVELRLGVEARVLGGDAAGIDADVAGERVRAAYVFNCTYAGLDSAGIPLRSRMRKELAEIVLIAPPPELRNLGVTVIDGPFFSTMPFPPAGLHSLSHVRYTPHESNDGPLHPSLVPHRTNRMAMMRDSARYLPCLARATVSGSIFEVKATLTRNEQDDGRPILIERAASLPRVLSLLGAKIDNIYDVRRFLRLEQWQLGS